jgi:hypothetical protein
MKIFEGIKWAIKPPVAAKAATYCGHLTTLSVGGFTVKLLVMFSSKSLFCGAKKVRNR